MDNAEIWLVGALSPVNHTEDYIGADNAESIGHYRGWVRSLRWCFKPSQPLLIIAESSLDCVSEEVRGVLPSLISLPVSVDVKPHL